MNQKYLIIIVVLTIIIASVVAISLNNYADNDNTELETSQNDNPMEEYYVDEDMAWKHAVVFATEWVSDETTGLEEWDGATVQKDPVTVYDIHGKKLFYEFAVTKDEKAIGEMEMAASKVLGNSLHRVITTPPLDREIATSKAMEAAEKEYPKYKILSTKPVCYSYPKEGVMVILEKPEDKEEKTVVIAIYTSTVVPLRESEMEGDLGAWSLYDKIPDEEVTKRVEQWNEVAERVDSYKMSELSGVISKQ
ncbi:MAG: hypothetical protein SVM80_05510 [Halobacteriota archaeon]|nr:hypothetical protein [Halobacteriota archaeon]